MTSYANNFSSVDAARLARALLLAAGCALLALSTAAGQATTTVSYEGVSYVVSSLNTTGAALSANGSVTQTTVWWSNATTAEAICNQVGSTLGTPNNVGSSGPLFIDGLLVSIFNQWNGYWWQGSSCSRSVVDVSSAQPLIIALSALQPPSPPNCSQAVLSPSILSSRLNSQVCTANKDARAGKVPKLSTAVTLSVPPDANNETANINITDIVMDSATASWKCACRPTKRDNCTCVPNAVLLGGGSFRVMPQWRRFTLPGAIVDTTFQVSFTATTSSGSCSGTAVICSAWGVRPNRPPPACRPFNSTGVTRPALACI